MVNCNGRFQFDFQHQRIKTPQNVLRFNRTGKRRVFFKASFASDFKTSLDFEFVLDNRLRTYEMFNSQEQQCAVAIGSLQF